MTIDDQKNGAAQHIQTPIDPNNDMNDKTDTYGMTGFTQNFTANQQSTQQQQEDALPPTQNTMSSAMKDRINDIATETDTLTSSTSSTIHGTVSDPGGMGNNGTSPSVQGEQSVSGDMPDPEADDDTLQNAQIMGFQLDEDSENPKPLNMSADFDRGEEEAHK